MRIVIATLFLCVWSTVASAQVIFSMDTSAGAATLAGFTTEATSEYPITWTRARVAGAGPDGQDVYRFTALHDATQMNGGAQYGGEHYLGWDIDVGTAPSVGTSRFGRLRLKIDGGSNFEAVDSSDGSASQTIHKLVIIGDGGSGRTILSLHGQTVNDTYYLVLGIDGGGDVTITEVPRGVWQNIQWETRLGSGGSGYLKLWLNNDTYASPSGQASGLTLTSTRYDLVSVGRYMNRMIASTGSYGFDLTDFEWASSFDSGWNDGGATVPDAPTIGTAVAGNGQCSVSFTPPGNDGGAAITSYTATSSPGSITGTASGSPITVPGLSNGTGYTFTVYATNSEGNSSNSSASNTCTPTAGNVRLRVRGQ